MSDLESFIHALSPWIDRASTADVASTAARLALLLVADDEAAHADARALMRLTASAGAHRLGDRLDPGLRRN